MNQTTPPQGPEWGMRGIGLVCVGIGLAILAWNWKWISNVIQGPVSVETAQVRKLASLDELPNQWVSLRSPRVVDTGVRKVFGRRDPTAYKYLLAQLEDRWVIVKARPDFTGDRVTGYLNVCSNEYEAEAVKEVNAAVGRAREKLLPFQVDAAYDPRMQSCIVLIPAGVFLAFGLAMGAGFMDRGQEPPSPFSANRTCV